MSFLSFVKQAKEHSCATYVKAPRIEMWIFESLRSQGSNARLCSENDR